MRRLEVRPLCLRRIAQAFPLIQLAMPDRSLDDWTSYAKLQLGDPKPAAGGILTVVDERDYILGLLDYSLDWAIEHGRTLQVRNVIAIDFLDISKREVALALMGAMERLAAKLECAAIHTNLPESNATSGDRWFFDLLVSSGHQRSQINLCKPLR